MLLRFPVRAPGLFRGAVGPHGRTRTRRAGRNSHLPDVPSLPAGCLSGPITASTISDLLIFINYDTREQFDLCLSNEVLKANLEALLEQPLTKEYLCVIKKKLEQVMGDTGQEPLRSPISMGALWDGRVPASPAAGTCAAGCRDEGTREGPLRLLLPPFPFPSLTLFPAPLGNPLQIYPSGIPEKELKVLGPLSRLYTAEEISLWPVMSNDTLLALLNPFDGMWSVPQVNLRQQRGAGAGEPKPGPVGAQAQLGAEALPGGGTAVLQRRSISTGASSFPDCVQPRELCFPGPAAGQQVPGPGGHLDWALASENRGGKPVQSAGGAARTNISRSNQVSHFLGVIFSPAGPLGPQGKGMEGWQAPTCVSALPVSCSQLRPEPPAPWAGTGCSSPPTNTRALALVWGDAPALTCDPLSPRTAGQLNITSCSQTKKDQLYKKAQEAFAGQAGATRAYYCRIRPYLGRWFSLCPLSHGD